MKKMMLIGRTDSGKTTLADVLQKGYSDARKTQSIERIGTVVDTPGEFVETEGSTEHCSSPPMIRMWWISWVPGPLYPD